MHRLSFLSSPAFLHMFTAIVSIVISIGAVMLTGDKLYAPASTTDDANTCTVQIDSLLAKVANLTAISEAHGTTIANYTSALSDQVDIATTAASSARSTIANLTSLMLTVEDTVTTMSTSAFNTAIANYTNILSDQVDIATTAANYAMGATTNITSLLLSASAAATTASASASYAMGATTNITSLLLSASAAATTASASAASAASYAMGATTNITSLLLVASAAATTASASASYAMGATTNITSLLLSASAAATTASASAASAATSAGAASVSEFNAAAIVAHGSIPTSLVTPSIKSSLTGGLLVYGSGSDAGNAIQGGATSTNTWWGSLKTRYAITTSRMGTTDTAGLIGETHRSMYSNTVSQTNGSVICVMNLGAYDAKTQTTPGGLGAALDTLETMALFTSIPRSRRVSASDVATNGASVAGTPPWIQWKSDMWISSFSTKWGTATTTIGESIQACVIGRFVAFAVAFHAAVTNTPGSYHTVDVNIGGNTANGGLKLSSADTTGQYGGRTYVFDTGATDGAPRCIMLTYVSITGATASTTPLYIQWFAGWDFNQTGSNPVLLAGQPRANDMFYTLGGETNRHVMNEGIDNMAKRAQMQYGLPVYYVPRTQDTVLTGVDSVDQIGMGTTSHRLFYRVMSAAIDFGGLEPTSYRSYLS